MARLQRRAVRTYLWLSSMRPQLRQKGFKGRLQVSQPCKQRAPFAGVSSCYRYRADRTLLALLQMGLLGTTGGLSLTASAKPSC